MSEDRDSNPKKRRGGGAPGNATGSGTAPGPEKTGSNAANEPGRLARNDTNLLDLPVTRMRVGWYNGAVATVTRFRLWVPTNTGGVLTVKHLKGGTVDLRKPFAKVLQPAAESATLELKAGEFGEYFVVARGNIGDEIHCTFIQIGFSHDGTGDSDPPLIPWNFWYWPSAKSEANVYSKQAGEVMARFGQAFGYDPEACRTTEFKDHGTDAPAGGGADWQGHCHNSAPASAFFEEPKAVTIKGQAFTIEEMKYLAAELFGNYGQYDELAWELKRGASKPAGENGRWYLPGYFKPSEPMGRAAFVNALKHEFREASESLDSEKLTKFAEDLADAYINSAGGEDAFKKLMTQWMGELAAEFYQALIDFMRVKKQPLVANMRSYNGDSGPEQVWNQVYFWYRASYSESSMNDRERTGQPDDTDITISCEMRANRDFRNLDGSPTGFPATVSGSDVTPVDGKSLVFRHRWRILFDDDSGKIVVQDSRNRWVEIKGDQAQTLYAPTKLLQLDKLRTSRRSGNKESLGNKYVKTELLTGGWLKAHKRFQ